MAKKIWHMGMGQNPGTPVVHIKIAGIFGNVHHIKNG